MKRKRCLWIVNHNTLLPIEATLLSSFGFEFYLPKLVPQTTDYRSAIVDYSYDSTLSLDRYILELLNRHNFYEELWSPTLTDVLNDNFDLLITSWSGYTKPLFEAIRKFNGTVVARVFGREHPARYSDFLETADDYSVLLSRIHHGSCNFYFGQAYDNLGEIELPDIQSKAITLPVGLPKQYFAYKDSWKGNDSHAILLCPDIGCSVYYKNLYDEIINDFGYLPIKLFGRQPQPVGDTRVLPYLSHADLINLYQQARLMIYPSKEPRHLHYSPLEAMIVGTPVLYRRNGLMDHLANTILSGACETTAEMQEKAKRILSGDIEFADKIRKEQTVIIESLSDDNVHTSWKSAMQSMGFS